MCSQVSPPSVVRQTPSSGVPPEMMTDEMRRQSKTVNFGIIYGISAFGLAERLGIPRNMAGEMIEQGSGELTYTPIPPEHYQIPPDAPKLHAPYGEPCSVCGRVISEYADFVLNLMPETACLVRRKSTYR